MLQRFLADQKCLYPTHVNWTLPKVWLHFCLFLHILMKLVFLKTGIISEGFRLHSSEWKIKKMFVPVFLFVLVKKGKFTILCFCDLYCFRRRESWSGRGDRRNLQTRSCWPSSRSMWGYLVTVWSLLSVSEFFNVIFILFILSPKKTETTAGQQSSSKSSWKNVCSK